MGDRLVATGLVTEEWMPGRQEVQSLKFTSSGVAHMDACFNRVPCLGKAKS